jgi:predicted hotdog family 3-hydroxylacyl-ACP dehydratase
MALNTIMIGGDEILNLIPQKPPMVMVDKLFLHEEKRCISGLKISGDNIFVIDGFFQECGLTENIAQTAALHTGYTCKIKSTAVPIGFIAAVKNLNIYFLPQNGDEIITETMLVYDVFEFTVISGKITCNGKVVADCEMKIYTQKSE